MKKLITLTASVAVLLGASMAQAGFYGWNNEDDPDNKVQRERVEPKIPDIEDFNPDLDFDDGKPAAAEDDKLKSLREGDPLLSGS